MREGVVMREIPEPEEKEVCVKAQNSEWPARRQMGPRVQGEGDSVGLGGGGGGGGGVCDWGVCCCWV
jgi:hypothetical protein